MQDCFRKYPEVYGAEIADDDAAEAEAEAGGAAAGSPAPAKGETSAESDRPTQATEKPAKSDTSPAQSSKPATDFTTEETKAGPTDAPKGAHPATPVGDGDAQLLKEDLEASEVSEHGIPQKSFDATSANTKASK